MMTIALLTKIAPQATTGVGLGISAGGFAKDSNNAYGAPPTRESGTN
jgi:hypothetical protein